METEKEKVNTEEAKKGNRSGGCSDGGGNPFVDTMKEGMDKVFGGMKTAMVAIAAATALVSAGCKSIPTADKIESVAQLVGVSAGMVVNMTKIDPASKATVIEIMKIAEATVPKTNETFVAAWTPIAKTYVDKLVADGKVDRVQGDLILTGFGIACRGLDYVFDVRYPKARQYEELVSAAVHGFIGGFTSVVNVEAVKLPATLPEYDKGAFDHLRSSN